MTAEMKKRYAILQATFPGLNRIELDALIAVAQALREGLTTAAAYERGNRILVAAGEEPVPLP